MAVLEQPANMVAMNLPPILFGATYFHSHYSKSNIWPESIRKNGIHRGKFVVAGVVISLFGSFIQRLTITSKVFKESLESHGYKYPPTDDQRKLIARVMKQISKDSKNGISLTESTPIQSSPIQNSPVQNAPVPAEQTPVQNVYENQDKFQNPQSIQNPYEYNPVQPNNNYNSWSD